jgi:uncharacterized MAPEG superfamily protein
MTIADWCILAAAVLPYLPIAIAKLSGRAEFDNAAPRNPAFYAEGLRARAWGAHLNSFEAFAIFAAAVLVAEMRDAPQWAVNALALCFIITRLLYIGMYIGNRPTLRSALWVVGFIISMMIFAVASL